MLSDIIYAESVFLFLAAVWARERDRKRMEGFSTDDWLANGVRAQV